jgi:exonuclease III
MDISHRANMRTWKVLCCNVRGLNSQHKWSAIRSKIVESNCDIICLQEIKREVFDHSYLKKFCPVSFDCFEYIPSVGASGGLMVIWKSNKFSRSVIFQNAYAMSIEFSSTMSNVQWVLTNVYVPCTPEGKEEFLDWFHDIDMAVTIDWLIVGDFNLI